MEDKGREEVCLKQPSQLEKFKEVSTFLRHINRKSFFCYFLITEARMIQIWLDCYSHNDDRFMMYDLNFIGYQYIVQCHKKSLHFLHLSRKTLGHILNHRYFPVLEFAWFQQQLPRMIQAITSISPLKKEAYYTDYCFDEMISI